MDNTALFNLSYGVYVITTWGEGKATGCTANAAMQITSSPATIAISINHDNYTNKCIKDTDKFEGIEPLVKEFTPVLPQAISYITCKVINTMETDTHTIFLGEVTDAGNLSKDTPMTYSYYHKVVKGSTPKNAPTYKGD